ncbi:MAG: flagellar basal body protein FliL [Cereibacter sphaeroides]|uniref:Flagellar protein FliL n=1 Tax=Cereibacter sphaeroides TaxID=1063 RepID=A0A2W5S3R0_CERSP|nr:MAG: flagellar basal body protein FliL [Cereibacter sphaeroides]
MADISHSSSPASPRRSWLPLLLGLGMTAAAGAGGFYATYSGLFLGSAKTEGAKAEALPDIAFVAVDPLILMVKGADGDRYLRFASQLEVPKDHAEEVRMLMPRILDVLNGYLRAVEVAELEDPTALVRLRAQMLRRIQIVTGEGRVQDLLISEFVLN